MNELLTRHDDLFGDFGVAYQVYIIHAIFDLVEEDFDGEVNVVQGVHLEVILAQLVVTDLPIRSEKVGE